MQLVARVQINLHQNHLISKHASHQKYLDKPKILIINFITQQMCKELVHSNVKFISDMNQLHVSNEQIINKYQNLIQKVVLTQRMQKYQPDRV